MSPGGVGKRHAPLVFEVYGLQELVFTVPVTHSRRVEYAPLTLGRAARYYECARQRTYPFDILVGALMHETGFRHNGVYCQYFMDYFAVFKLVIMVSVQADTLKAGRF